MLLSGYCFRAQRSHWERASAGFFRVLSLVLFLTMALFANSAAAGSGSGFDERLAALDVKGFAKKAAAVEALAATGDPRAVPVLEAMLAGRLYLRKADRRLVIAERRDGALRIRDAASGEDLGAAGRRTLSKIKVNNRLRRTLRGALGALTLASRDPARRAAAADAIFRSRPPALAEPLERALAVESDTAVKARMARALAAVRLVHGKDRESRLAAVTLLARYADPEVRALLRGLLVERRDGTPVERDPDLRAAAAAALAEIERRDALWRMAGNLFQGLSLGSVLLLAAIGLAITFGVMGVINMAHGEMVMLGAYATFVVQEAFRTFAPAAFDFSLLVAVPVAFAAAGLVGVAVERTVIRFLYGRPLETLLATWGLSLVLQQLVRTVFGPTNREVGTPSWMQGAIQTAEGLTLTYNRIAIVAFSFAVFAVLVVVLRRTWFGLQVRAVTQNRAMASAMGIRTGRIDALTFGLGSGIAGIAGVALSQIDNVSPNLGQSYIIDSFLVVVFGGVGNLWGTLVGALSLGLVNKVLEPYTGAVLGKIVVLVAIVLFIQKRPRGLFALRGRAAEG